LLSLASGHVDAGELSPATLQQRLDLLLPDLEGRQRQLDEYRGQVVLVNFWASWCTPCLEEMPSIQRLVEAMRGTPFAVIGVNVGEGVLRVKAMVKRLGIGFPVLLDEDSAAFQRWGAKVLPTTYVLDGEGVIRYLGLGPLEWDSVEVVDLLHRVGTGAPQGDSD
jgi:thiol-disulfide isomerase/thioredoxin